MISLKHYQALVAVARYKSFSLAAQRLSTTQPNISNRLKALEQACGEPLFKRSKSGIEPTRQGTALVSQAQNVLNEHDKARAIIGGQQSSREKIHLGVSEIVVQTWLPEFLRLLSAQLPGLELALTVDLSNNLSQALKSQKLDLCFQTDPKQEDTISQIKLGDHPMRFFKSADSSLSDTLGGSSEHLALLLPAHNTLPHTLVKGQLEAGAFAQQYRIHESTSLTAIERLTSAGLGIGLLLATTQNQALIDIDLGINPPTMVCYACVSKQWSGALEHQIIGLAETASTQYHFL